MSVKFAAAWDMEANDLLFGATKWHCMWVENMITGERRGFADQPGYTPIIEGLKWLETADFCVGHNSADYDDRMVEKFYPEIKLPKSYDTMVMLKEALPPDKLWDVDIKLVKTGKLPQKYAKRYSLAAMGYRLGEMKGDYAGGWEEFNVEMYDYNEQDVVVQREGWKWCCALLGWDWQNPPNPPPAWSWSQDWLLGGAEGFSYSGSSLDMEDGVHRLVLEQQKVGYGFDVQAGTSLSAKLRKRDQEIRDILINTFGAWWVPLDDPEEGYTCKRTVNRKLVDLPDVTHPRFNAKGARMAKDYVGPPMENIEEGSQYVRIKWHEFNPSSRSDLAERLQVLYGWEPVHYGDNGIPTLDESTVKSLPDHVVPKEIKDLLMEFFIVEKTYGALAGGKKAWLKMLGQYDRSTNFGTETIHCAIGTLDAITGRGIHREPNLSQVPKVAKGKDKEILLGFEGKFGFECRSLFGPTVDGWEQTGTDCSALEFALLGHDLALYDGGAFAERVGDPNRDVHEENGALTGLSRNDTKTVGYMYLFGAGPGLVGEAVGYDESEIDFLLRSKRLESYERFMRKVQGSAFKEFTEQERCWIAKGSIVNNKFESGIEGLKELKQALKDAAEDKGYLKMLGGDRVWVKKPHLALNYRLQGNGARVCKAWMLNLNARLRKEGLKWGRDYTQLGWFHDELQFQRIKGLHDMFKHHSDAAIKEVGSQFGLRVTLRTETKSGRNWAECH